MRDAAHRRQHCCAIIEDMACSEFNLRLVAYCSWVERWDDGGQGAVPLLRCCVLFVVAVVDCCCCFVFACVYNGLRVLVCSVIVEARRLVTRAGCRPPAPTLLCYY